MTISRIISAGLTGLFLAITAQAAAYANEVEDFVAQLKSHYADTLNIQKFSLNYHYLSNFRGNWDYASPDRYLSVRTVDVDMTKKYFYDHDYLYLAGGMILDRVQFQNDRESYSYERNGSTKGKRVLNKGMGNFDAFQTHNMVNIGFLAVRPLLAETDIKGTITLKTDPASGTKTLAHISSDKSVTNYTFSTSPIRLLSIENKKKRSKFIYSDHQTTEGFTYARTLLKYYGGAAEPNFISYINRFTVIDQVDPVRLQLPEGYGPELPKSDGILRASEVASNLYLITTNASSRNSMFQVNGDNITVFEASSSPRQAEKVIELITEKFPNKAITAVHVSHHYRSQIAGLLPFAKRDIKILADDYTIGAIKAYPRFQKDIHTFKFEAIKHGQVRNGATFYTLENTRAKRHSFVHFKDSGILFQANFLHVSYDNTIPKIIPSYTRSFLDFIKAQQLNVTRIVASQRNNNITPEVMHKIHQAYR